MSNPLTTPITTGMRGPLKGHITMAANGTYRNFAIFSLKKVYLRLYFD